MSETTVTRRRRIGTGTLAALAASLPGVAPTVAAQPATETVIINADDLAAECQKLCAEYKRTRTEALALSDQLSAMLTPEQNRAASEAFEAATTNYCAELEWQAAELARHLPGFAPIVRMAWLHINAVAFQQPGACCTVAEGFEP